MDAPQLLDRPFVVVDAQVDDDVGEPGIAAVALDDEQASRLLAAAVAAGLLRGGEAIEQPLGERPARAALEGLRERVDGRCRDEDVALGRVAGPGAPARPVVALGAGERGASALRVHDPELAVLAPVVRLGQSLHGLLRARPSRRSASPSGP